MVEQFTVSPNLPVSDIVAAFGEKLEFSKALAMLTSFETGGSAKYFLVTDSAETTAQAVKTARRLKIPIFIFGGGSNLLVSDSGFDGLVVKPEIEGLKLLDDLRIESGSGEKLSALVDFATEQACTGLEFAAGIWGSVGGAVYGNAGAFGGDVGSILIEATLVTRAGKIERVTQADLAFDYRHSRLKETGDIIVSAVFQVKKGDRDTIKTRVNEILAQREQKHPIKGTAGCFFRNIPDSTQKFGKLPAGRLLEEVGAKRLAVGGASVYPDHANIIVNTGNATSKDIRQLADIMKKKVLDRFGIELQEEIQQLGTFQ